ncbi:MAG TPA: hypothetical protein VIM10_05955 [Actinopolymorphaceae bacterium]
MTDRSAPHARGARPARAHGSARAAGPSGSPQRLLLPAPAATSASALDLQRTAGNQVTSLVLQRYDITVNGGGRVSDSDAFGANMRESVLLVMDRLHSIWAMPDAAYGPEHALVSALPAGAIVPVGRIPATIAALLRSRDSSLAAPVAQTQLRLALSDGVGEGQPNVKADVAAIQDFVHANGLLSDAAYGTPDAHGERAILDASGANVIPMLVPQTMAAVSAVKARLLAGTPLALGASLSGPLAASETADIAAYEAAKARHDANRITVRQWIDAGFAQNADRRLKNTCEWIHSRRTPFFLLTRTHDSAARAAAAGSPGGAAYFSFPDGDVYSPTVYYRRKMPSETFDNTGINVEASPTVDGFQDSSGHLAEMESTIAQGRAYLLGVLMHEVQHDADAHGGGALELYKTEFRAYWLGSKEFNALSPRRWVWRKGADWTARQWGIFQNLYNDPVYGYVKSTWDAEAALPPAARVFRKGVLAFRFPASVNQNNSIRIAALTTAVTATSHADCAADTVAAPNANVGAVRAAALGLAPDDKRDVAASAPMQQLLSAHLNGRPLRQVRRSLR